MDSFFFCFLGLLLLLSQFEDEAVIVMEEEEDVEHDDVEVLPLDEGAVK